MDLDQPQPSKMPLWLIIAGILIVISIIFVLFSKGKDTAPITKSSTLTPHVAPTPVSLRLFWIRARLWKHIDRIGRSGAELQ